MAVASLVLGIVAILFTFFSAMGWLGIIAGIIGIILGSRAKKECPSSIATAGYLCSIIGTCTSGIGYIACVACVGALNTL